ncbi:O-antigen ligase family protein [Arthrobacter sp. SPG23]|uniref:O-antigen ligase family protein n=1 Tax=Arthrobacter sp. SPG23 TaxID=1610703 RepID=UPI0009E59A30|nr:O-antigen ligase family protein [Arthrobacter sp. SPG23]
MDLAGALVVIIGVVLAAFFVSSTRRLSFLVILAAFVTRPAFDVGGLNIRLELIVGGLCLLRIIHDVLSRSGRPLSAAVRWSVSCVAAWLMFAAVTSLNIPPMPQKSLSVLIWCVLNVLTAVWIARTPNSWYWIIRWGSMAALVCSALAIAFWIAATFSLFNFGVQADPAYGGFAAYVFSIEANILGGLLCLWALIAVYNPLSAVPPLVRLVLAVLVPVAIVATHTRAALVAYVLGLLACLILRPDARKVAAASVIVGGISATILLFSGTDKGLGKFADVFDIDGGTGGLRYRVNNVALEEWWSSPNRLVGLGWNSFGQRHIDETQPALLVPGYIGNLPVQIAYDAGLIGILWVGLAVAAVVLCVVRNRRVGLLLAFAVPYLSFSIATSALWLLETWIFVGLAWGWSSAVGSKFNTISSRRDSSRMQLKLSGDSLNAH